MNQEDAKLFLEKEVPYTGTPSWLTWQEECNRLGATAPSVFIGALAFGPEHTHYPALLGLRIFGYEAWGEGDGNARTYKIRPSQGSEWQNIVPLHKPPDYDDPSEWQEIARGT